MTDTTVTVSLGRVLNTGNYSNFRPMVSATARLEEGETIQDVTRRLHEQVDHQLQKIIAYDALLREYSERVDFDPWAQTETSRLRGVVFDLTNTTALHPHDQERLLARAKASLAKSLERDAERARREREHTFYNSPSETNDDDDGDDGDDYEDDEDDENYDA